MNLDNYFPTNGPIIITKRNYNINKNIFIYY